MYPVKKAVTHAHATMATLAMVQAAPTRTSVPPVPVTPMLAAPTLTVVTSALVTTDSGKYFFVSYLS